jgi:hypothetical protein
MTCGENENSLVAVAKAALVVVRFFDHRLYINHGRTVDRFDRADQETTLIDR